MPRKQNGFGNIGGPGFKKFDSITKGKGTKALGNYPAKRDFGSTFTRSVIEQYNIESTWARWRRGMEYYFQGAYLNFTETNAVLYQGTEHEVPVTFDGYRFATRNADSRTHYAIRRSIDQNRQLGVITEIESDQITYPLQYKNREIWTKISTGGNTTSDDLLLRSTGERVTDGITAANIIWILTTDKHPAIFLGKSPKEGTSVNITIPLVEIRASQFIQDNFGNLQSLVGKSVYMPQFETTRPITQLDQFIDSADSVGVRTADFVGGEEINILETTDDLPPLLSEIDTLPSIFKTLNTTGSLNGTFVIEKNEYQRFYGQQYLTADVVRNEVDRLSYAIQPWIIQSIRIDESAGLLYLTSVPFQASLRLFAPSANERWVVFADNSFTKELPDFDADGNYNHKAPIPGEKTWTKIQLDVDAWQDEVFTADNALTFADVYTCSCPSYLRAIIRSPEVYDDRENKLNRQVRAPFPTAKGVSDFDVAGLGRAATIAQSWATGEYKKGFKVCKHTIASMFINKVRVQEPSSLPTYELRQNFEEKLANDINEVAEEFNAQLRRSEITTVELIYSLAEALNLDDVELGYVLLTSNF